MNDYIKELQLILYNTLIDFDSICKENSLTYYICGGTLLGAIRHKGFIPWDDDIDISMPRSDYDKLIAIHEQILPDKYFLQHHTKTKNYHLNFSKIVNKATTLVELDGKDYVVKGCFIDIFPIDGAGNTYQEAVNRRNKANKYLRISSWVSYSKSKIKNKPLYKRIIIRLAQMLINQKLAKKLLDNYLRRKPYASSEYVAVYVGQFGLKEIMKREVYGSPIRVLFCEHFFNAPEKYEEHLKIKYGEYKKLPPKEKRVSNHKILFVNLDLPYEEFKIDIIKDIICNKKK